MHLTCTAYVNRRNNTSLGLPLQPASHQISLQMWLECSSSSRAQTLRTALRSASDRALCPVKCCIARADAPSMSRPTSLRTLRRAWWASCRLRPTTHNIRRVEHSNRPLQSIAKLSTFKMFERLQHSIVKSTFLHALPYMEFLIFE